VHVAVLRVGERVVAEHHGYMFRRVV
jgi:hypothetical protein